MRTGTVILRLCDGPVWHYKYIKELAPAIVSFMYEELGGEETVKRFSDPVWYQTFATVLGFEWQYSGATTVPFKALKETLTDFPIKFYGGKGRIEDVPEDIMNISRYTSKMDNVAFQDGYDLYFHGIIAYEDTVSIINQGMNVKEKLTRRYHWMGDKSSSASGVKGTALHFFTEDNRELRKTIMDVLQDEHPERIKKKILQLTKSREGQTTLTGDTLTLELPYYLHIPRKIEEKALYIAKNVNTFEEVVMVKGMGKNTLRGLAYVAYLIYNAPVSWEDPVLFTYSFGTKVGIPYMVNIEAVVEAAEFLKRVVIESRMGKKEKVFAVRNLSKLFSILRKCDTEESCKGSA